MPLPELIEIVPLEKRVKATITVPGSKSVTNRALILAALAEGEVVLRGALWSEDTQVMVECLQELGYMVNVVADPEEPANRTVTVYGKGGEVPSGGTEEQPLELFVGNAGTAARFLSAFVCLGKGVYRIYGVPRMHERPQAALFQALRQLSYRVDTPNDKLPAVIHGTGPRPGKCEVSIQESSQFASALLLSAPTGGWDVKISDNNSEEASYVAMTSKMIQAFPKNGGTFQVEPDASSGSYFLALEELSLPELKQMEYSERFGVEVDTTYSSNVSVANWPASGWQIDQSFPEFSVRMGWDPYEKSKAEVKEVSGLYHSLVLLPGEEGRTRFARTITRTGKPVEGPFEIRSISRAKDLGDSIMTAIVIAPLVLNRRGGKSMAFTELGRLRVQECERVMALKAELTRCGAKVVETGDTLEVFASDLRGAEIETYNDHRMAMCFSILGLKVPGIKIKNPACVKKTFPNFFQKLAGPQPGGLGATVLDGGTRQPLLLEELFAD